MVASGYLLAFRVCDNTGGVMLFFLCYFSFRFWIAFQSSVYGCRCRALFSLAILDIFGDSLFQVLSDSRKSVPFYGGSLFMVSETSNYVHIIFFYSRLNKRRRREFSGLLICVNALLSICRARAGSIFFALATSSIVISR